MLEHASEVTPPNTPNTRKKQFSKSNVKEIGSKCEKIINDGGMTGKRINSAMKDYSLSSTYTWKQIRTRLMYERRPNKRKSSEKETEHSVTLQFAVLLTAAVIYNNLSAIRNCL